MRWITREDAKVDRIACPWLIKRFVDRDTFGLSFRQRLVLYIFPPFASP
jgi:hypothetical protein